MTAVVTRRRPPVLPLRPELVAVAASFEGHPRQAMAGAAVLEAIAVTCLDYDVHALGVGELRVLAEVLEGGER